MSKANVKSLVSDMALTQNEAGTTENFYRSTMQQLGLKPLFTDVRLLEVTAGTSQYTIPDDLGLILEMFYDSEIVLKESLHSMNIHNPAWRDLKGPPEFYTIEPETSKQFRLVPQPQVSSKDFSFLFGEPLGVDFPEYSVGLIHTKIQDENPDWLDLPIALKVAAQEFLKESKYQDVEFAQICDQLADMVLDA